MKKWLVVLLVVLICAGCRQVVKEVLDTTLVQVQVVSTHKQEEWHDAFDSITVERLDTKERYVLSNSKLGVIGDTFSMRKCDLHW